MFQPLQCKCLELLDGFPGGDGWVGRAFGGVLLVKNAGCGLYNKKKKKSEI
jgi:hypothetical protein